MVYQDQQLTKQLGELFHGIYCSPVGRKTVRIKSGDVPGRQRIAGKNWRLAKEVDYIQRRAAAHERRFVSVGPLVLFSTDTGDAWLLDPPG